MTLIKGRNKLTTLHSQIQKTNDTTRKAEDIVRNDYKTRGANENQTLNYKTNLEQVMNMNIMLNI